MKLNKFFAFAMVLLFAPMLVLSQVCEKGTPLSFDQNMKSGTNIPVVEMPAFDIAAMLYEDSIDIANKALKPYRFANEFNVDLDMTNSGVWETLQDGSRIWRLKIKSEGAYSLHFVFDPYIMPEGASVYIYNNEKDYILGALTARNNKESNILPTTLVKGEEVTIEYNEPAGSAQEGVLHIAKIYHAYRNFFKSEKDGQFGQSGSCNIDINCPEGNNWQTEKRGVCRILLGGGLCSGTMLNNTSLDGTPYFLTANHCTGSPYSNWVFNFKWEVATCGSTTDPYPSTSSIPSVSGCTLRATTTVLDFCLVEMSTMPDQVTCEPYWCGWNNSATPAANTTGIHHPMGDVKKICVDNDPPAIGDYGSGYDANSHWHIAEWDGGVTEGGSSGSALFDENHHVVGDLTGGQAACGYVFNDYYARFDRSWDDYTPTDQQLKYWLDPTNSGVTTLDGFDFYNSGLTADFTGTPTTIPVGSTVTFTDGSTPAGTITSWSWDFGGAGASPATQNTQGPHVVLYNTPGLYTITLTVSDGTSNDSKTKTDYILVEDTVLNANFTASVTTVNVGGNVTFTDMSSPSAQIVSWDWNFGDPAAAPGQTANTQGPHVVTYNTVGFHTVTLTVGNGTSTDTETKTNYIEVIDPNAVNADFHASVTTLIAGQTTDFFDDSQNGPPVSWTWDFGNGTNSSVQNPTGIAYNTVGLYTVSLTVNDGTNTDTETKVDYIEVIDSTYLPVADFTSNFTTIFVNNTVDFYDMSSGSPNAWEWTFDGGTPLNSAVQDPTGVLYTTTGVYPVTLSVTNLLGSDTVTKTDYITVVDSSFISDTLFANFDVVGSRLIVQGATVLFVDLTVGYPASWYWEFGSTGVIPTTSTDQHPSCQFTTPGFYDIMLIVSNGIVTDTLIKEDYIVVTSEPWPNPNGFCDTISNIQTGEFPLTFRHLAPAKWGYFPGHNEYTVRAYAEKFDNYMFSEVFGLIVPVVKAYEVSATSKVRFTVWDMDSLTGKPLNELDHKDLTVGSFTPYLYHTVEFDSPVPIPLNGKFFVGFQLYYDATAQDTFAVYMAPNRGIGGENTLYVKRPSWKLPSEVLGDTLNTSMAIELVGCLTISVEETDESGKIIIYPNPANDFLNVEFRDMNGSDANIAIIDMTGRMISTKTEDHGNGLYKINLQTLSDGIYFVTIQLNGKKYSRKISVLR